MVRDICTWRSRRFRTSETVDYDVPARRAMSLWVERRLAAEEVP
jgi:hypothetical protein